MNLNKPIKDYLFVVVQLLFFGVYLLPLHISIINLPEWLRCSGLSVLGLGLIFGIAAIIQLKTKLSPFPSPVASGHLITTGIFKFSRHPIYTGLLLAGFGYAVYQMSIYKALVATALSILFYYKSRYEERLMSGKFPAYADYKKRTRRFI